jgi:hypothetical protein
LIGSDTRHMTARSPLSTRPPRLLVSAFAASGCAAGYAIETWISRNVTGGPVHYDVRMYYAAAEAGLRYGWSTIYDQAILRSLSSVFPVGERLIDNHVTFASTPPLAWLFAPLTVFSEPVAYALWTVVSLAALVFGWYIAAPYTGIAKLTILLVVLALSPIFWSFYLGQPTMFVIASVASAWTLSTRKHHLAGGAALAIATFLKPQVVILVPAALLVAGHYRVVAGWAAGVVLLGIASALVLGQPGMIGWWNATRGIQHLPPNTEYTLAHFSGTGPLTYALWAAQGVMALIIAWRRRHELEIVFAVGLIATIATAAYLHEQDYSTLVLAAWLVLRTWPRRGHRWWLLGGIVSMQLLEYTAAPQLIFDALWLCILLVASFGNARAAHNAIPGRSQPAPSNRQSTSWSA